MSRVVVCGGGMAGLVAASTAADGGAEVTLLEKGDRLGGSARLSAGFIWTHSDLDALSRAIPDGNPSLHALVQSTFRDAISWLQSCGVGTSEWRTILDYGHGVQVDPAQMLVVLERRLAARGVRVRTGTSMHRLDVVDGAVRAVVVETATGTERIEADAVVLSTGGFQGNADLLTRFCVPRASNVYLRSNPWSTGDGFLAATEVGAAASAGLDAFYGHAMLAPPAKVTPTDFGEVTQYQGNFSVALNLRGHRFADESLGTGEEVLNQALARQPEGRGVYITDAVGASRPCLPPDLLITRVVLDRALERGAAVKAETLEDLTSGLECFGVDQHAALRTLEGFNDAMARGVTPLDVPRTRYREPLATPPYCAVSVKAAISFTMGGLAVDDEMRVLQRSASSSPMASLISDLDEYRPVPIRNLLAAGSDVGNLSNVGYMGGLASALTTGRVAGQNACKTSAGGE